jgi:dienelactone hydrolase
MVNIVDAYRALELLSTHPLIESTQIAVMGFSVGGKASLYSSVNRFQKLWGTSGREFAAFVSFYPGCNIRFDKDEDVSNKPIRVFHGAQDEWTSPSVCKEYIELLIAAGNDVEITIYDKAHHGFDSKPEQGAPTTVSSTFHVNCRFEEDSQIGEIVQEGYTPKDKTKYVNSDVDENFSVAIKKFVTAQAGGGDFATQFANCVADQVYLLNDDTKSAVIQHGVKKAFGKLPPKDAMALDQAFSTCEGEGGEGSDGWFLMHDSSCLTSKARIKYNKVAAKQSIQAVTEFFAETFSIDLSNLPPATSSTKSSDKKDSSTGKD